ncbi:MAG: hypothetical protein NTV86_00535 [Planctomycetota bacterium]|nr:hypothetical protein [Planctomycetota bacterium]
MHKTYAFLLSRHDFSPGLTMKALAERTVDRLTKDFIEGLEHGELWWTPMALVTNDGQVVNLAPEHENLGIDKWVTDFIASTSPDARLQEALRLAVQLAATEMGLYGCHTIETSPPNDGDKRIDSANREELTKDILAEIPSRLARLYEEAVGQPRHRDHLGDYWYRCSVRKTLAAQFEEFCSSMVPAFTYNPYARGCRCFDLRNDPTVPEEEDELMVLLVDLHE